MQSLTARTRSNIVREEMMVNAQQAIINVFNFKPLCFGVSVLLSAWLGSAGLVYLNPACLLHLPVMSYDMFAGTAYLMQINTQASQLNESMSRICRHFGSEVVDM